VDTIRALILDLKSSDPQVRETAAGRLEAIGRPAVRLLCDEIAGKPELPDPGTPEDWVRQLAHPDPEVRAHAETRLMGLAEEAIPVLSQALSDESPAVRDRAGWLLARARYLALVTLEGAEEALADRSIYVREAAVRSLKRFGAAAAPALCRALDDRDMFVRGVAAEALGELRERAAVPSLCALLETAGGDTGPLIAQALGQIGSGAAAPALARALETSDHGTRMASADALAEIAQRDPTPALRAAMIPLERLMRGELLTRGHYGRALRHVRTATQRLKPLPELPIPASETSLASEPLPIPAQPE